ncbi:MULTISPECIES: nucleotidyltransferase domain-containing protein [unclassified Nitrobacter]|uniref:nucleotidyltransferase domain-containing protein n=1 Tax=unclassified Nitrobacter TaxID=2620411 RepID=UPI000AAAB74A|nr:MULTISPECIES: nucleotidyltransferase domain-containing protein [unclassified Nitrobacter]
MIIKLLDNIPIIGTIFPGMGKHEPVSNLSNALFSRVQARVLGIFFRHPDQTFQLTEIFAKADSGRGAVQRELEKLTDVGIVSIIPFGNRKLYQVNRESPIFNELHQLVLKTTGIAEPLQEALAPYRQHITAAFVYGSIAKGSDTARSDIDLMIIGEKLGYSEIYSLLQKAETVLARPVNPNLMTMSEWTKKLKGKNSFVVKILSQPKLFIFGSEDELSTSR